jgi:2-succinyl-5-enolpyruvyl-6-hydroxy-3-cyclohexene-1-carboxylate synthase
MDGRINADWATALVSGLADAGVGMAVISPGSRSSPLALACLRHPAIDSRILLDERTAAFFALGQAKAEGRPVALICTSGSAVANWHPAVVEADLARLPLILLSADRPPELQDCGANQTVDQHSVFGHHLRAFHPLPPAEADYLWLGNLAARVVAQSLWPLAGPVQVNVPFREPLLAAEPVLRLAAPAPPRVVLPRLQPPSDVLETLADRFGGSRGVILAGAEPLPAEPIVRLAAALDWPILADPLSGLRFGEHDLSRVMAKADLFLRAGRPVPAQVLRFGALPISRAVANWLSSLPAEQVVVSGDSRWPDPQRSAALMIHADPALVADGLADRVKLPAPDGWLNGFRAAEDAAERLAIIHCPPEAAVVQAIIEILPDKALLFLANSMVVRDFDAFSGIGPKRLTILGNRGASGIDGNLATFFGAAATGRFSAAVAMVGDLTFLHDVGGLAAGQGVDATVCVLDNGGGAIFDHLPQATLPEFEQAWLTPQVADFGAAAQVWGHHYVPVAAARLSADLAAAVAKPGVSVLHLTIDRATSKALHRSLWAAASSSKEIPA